MFLGGGSATELIPSSPLINVVSVARLMNIPASRQTIATAFKRSKGLADPWTQRVALEAGVSGERSIYSKGIFSERLSVTEEVLRARLEIVSVDNSA